MADINQVISLGIGTPSGIPEFLTFGLQIGEAVGVIEAFGFIFSPSGAGAVRSPDGTGDVGSPDGTGTVISDRHG